MSWRIVWSTRAERDFGKLSALIRERVAGALRRYAETEQGDVVRLQGAVPPEWRLRTGMRRARPGISPSNIWHSFKHTAECTPERV